MGHTEWSDGIVHASGMTTAWTPKKVILGTTAKNQVVDVSGINEEDGGSTLSAITSRSYHSGGVNILYADGSVRFVKSSVDGNTWRAIGVAGGRSGRPGGLLRLSESSGGRHSFRKNPG